MASVDSGLKNPKNCSITWISCKYRKNNDQLRCLGCISCLVSHNGNKFSAFNLIHYFLLVDILAAFQQFILRRIGHVGGFSSPPPCCRWLARAGFVRAIKFNNAMNTPRLLEDSLSSSPRNGNSYCPQNMMTSRMFRRMARLVSTFI